MLSTNKSDFPKFLYLDQNIFIFLARAHLGLPDSDEYLDALAAVQSGVKSGKLVVPLSSVHVLETAAPQDVDRRKRLAKFMVELSGNHAVLPHMPVREAEIFHAVLREFGVLPKKPIRSWIIGKGLAFALGGKLDIETESQEIRELVEPVINNPKSTEHLLVHGLPRASIQQMRSEDIKAVPELEEIRRRAVAQLDADAMRRLEVATMFITGDARRDLLATLDALTISLDVFMTRLEASDDPTRFFMELPTVDIWATLSVARDRETGRPIHKNDTKDMAFMSVAIPYANFVVAEKYWTSVVKRTRLDSKYGTRVSSDVRELPQLLNDGGCI